MSNKKERWKHPLIKTLQLYFYGNPEEDGTEEVTDEQLELAVKSFADGIGGEEVKEAIDQIVPLAIEAAAMAEHRRNEASRLSDLASALDQRVAKMKSYMMAAADLIGTKKLEGETYKISVVNNGGALPFVGADGGAVNKEAILAELQEDPTKAHFIKVKPATEYFDFSEIKTAIKDGEVHLDSIKMGERGRHVKVS